MALSILLESALAFLGFSDPDVASWGKLISDGRKVLRTDWTVAFLPGLMILITVLSVSLLGQGSTIRSIHGCRASDIRPVDP